MHKTVVVVTPFQFNVSAEGRRVGPRGASTSPPRTRDSTVEGLDRDSAPRASTVRRRVVRSSDVRPWSIHGVGGDPKESPRHRDLSSPLSHLLEVWGRRGIGDGSSFG